MKRPKWTNTALKVGALTLAFATAGGTSFACPDVRLFGERHSYTGDDLYEPKEFYIVAGGENQIDNCRIPFASDRGTGWVTSRPDFSFDLSQMNRYALAISVSSDPGTCDPILLVNTAAGDWRYDDDDNPLSSNALDPIIILTNPSNGLFDVWVGAHDGDFCKARLELETVKR